jgi:hypothetical protein
MEATMLTQIERRPAIDCHGAPLPRCLSRKGERSPVGGEPRSPTGRNRARARRKTRRRFLAVTNQL